MFLRAANHASYEALIQLLSVVKLSAHFQLQGLLAVVIPSTISRHDTTHSHVQLANKFSAEGRKAGHMVQVKVSVSAIKKNRHI